MSLEEETYVMTDKDISEIIGLDCDVCKEPFDTEKRLPKHLACNHTFCLQCVLKLPTQEEVVNKSPMTFFKCPTCRRKINYYEDRKWLPNDHRVVRGLEAISKAKERYRNVCFKNNFEALEKFCKTCVTPLCKECILASHMEGEDHIHMTIAEAIKVNKRNLDNTERNCASHLRNLQTRDAFLASIKIHLDKVEIEEVSKIKSSFLSYRTLLTAREEELISMLQDKVQKRKNEVNSESLRGSECIKRLQTYSEQFSSARECNDARSIFKTHKQLTVQEKASVDIVSRDENEFCETYEFYQLDEKLWTTQLSSSGEIQPRVNPKLLQKPVVEDQTTTGDD